MKLIKSTSKFRRTIFVIALLLFSAPALYFVLVKRGYIPPLSYLSDVWCWQDCPAQATLHTPPEGTQLLNYDQTIPELVPTPTLDKAKTSVLIEKSKYRLTVYYDQEPIKSYPVVLGTNPVGDKLKKGDRKTPEGIFKIQDLYPHQNWSKFIWLDYPTKDSWKKHLRAKRRGKIFPSDTIGGEIGIHGVPAGQDNLINQRYNWTLGCISLKNPDVDELYQVIQTGTPVEIIP